MTVIEEVDENGLGEILRTETRGVVVDFWSPWCGPCRPLKRQLEKIAQDERNANWRFVALNTEAHPQAAAAFGVQSLPTVAIFRQERELHRYSGSVLPAHVETKLAELERTPSPVGPG